jgi:hypothetical protein
MTVAPKTTEGFALHVTRHMSGEYISVSNGKRPVSNIKNAGKCLRFVLQCK